MILVIVLWGMLEKGVLKQVRVAMHTGHVCKYVQLQQLNIKLDKISQQYKILNFQYGTVICITMQFNICHVLKLPQHLIHMHWI